MTKNTGRRTDNTTITKSGASDITACRLTVTGNYYPGIFQRIIHGVRL